MKQQKQNKQVVDDFKQEIKKETKSTFPDGNVPLRYQQQIAA